MVKHGYFVPPNRLDMPVRHCDFSCLSPTAALGDYPKVRLNGELQHYRRISPLIVAQIRNYDAPRYGVIIFAETLEHVVEIISLLPPDKAVRFSVECERLINAFGASRQY